MGWMNTLVQWREERQEKKMARHRERNTCPDCYGRGYTAIAYSDVAVYSSVDDLTCPGCGGSGTYDAWAATSPE